MFSESQLQQIREAVPISDLISDYVTLKRSGKNYQGLCPFHQERSPSFHVNPERESFHCFGCGVGGNLFHFVMKIENLSFPESVVKLADRAGIPLENYTQVSPEKYQKQQRQLEIHRQAAWYYFNRLKKLPDEDPASDYLKKRQIAAESREQFYLGHCPNQDSGLKNFLRKKGFTPEEIDESQFYTKSGREFFRGRVLFPIFRADNKVVGFGGRTWEDQGPKYLNSPESTFFKKRELFYGLHLAKTQIPKAQQVLIVEGYLDVITLHAHGYPTAIAPLGTALTPNHAKVLKRFDVEVVLLFDSDAAGEQASLRALEVLLSVGIFPKRVTLPPGEDPDSYLRRHGKLAFEREMQNRRNLFEALIDKWSESIPQDDSRLERKSAVARKTLQWIEKIPDDIAQQLYRRHLSEKLDLPLEWLNKAPRAAAPAPKTPNRKPDSARWLAEEEALFELWLHFPELRAAIREKLKPEDFCSETAIAVAEKFWLQGEKDLMATTGTYLLDIGEEDAARLSYLSMKAPSWEDAPTRRTALEQVCCGLQEKRLRQELKALKNAEPPEEISLIQKKIHALSLVIKNKERIYGER